MALLTSERVDDTIQACAGAGVVIL